MFAVSTCNFINLSQIFERISHDLNVEYDVLAEAFQEDAMWTFGDTDHVMVTDQTGMVEFLRNLLAAYTNVSLVKINDFCDNLLFWLQKHNCAVDISN